MKGTIFQNMLMGLSSHPHHAPEITVMEPVSIFRVNLMWPVWYSYRLGLNSSLVYYFPTWNE